MIKVIAALPRRHDFTRERFQQHWGTIHRDFALQIDRISRYVQSHPRTADLPGLPEAPYDGFPEVWFPDLDTALALGADPQYADGAHVDEPRFIDVDRMCRTWVHPHLVQEWDGFDGADTAGKILILGQTELVAEEMPETEVVEQLTSAVSILQPRRAVVGTALDDPRVRDRQGFDHVIELWWDDAASAVTAWRDGSEAFLAAASGVLDSTRSAVALVQEQRVRWPGRVVEADVTQQ